MAKVNLFPYTYQFRAVVNTTNFDRTGANSFIYTTIAFQADNNCAISDIEVNFTITPARGFSTANDPRTLFNIQVSYSDVLNVNSVTPATTPVTPSDTGNVIYNTFDGMKANFNTGGFPGPALFGNPFEFNHFHRFPPYDYLLKYNQFLYIHIGYLNDAFTLNGAGTLNGSVIMHILNTGLKT